MLQKKLYRKTGHLCIFPPDHLAPAGHQTQLADVHLEHSPLQQTIQLDTRNQPNVNKPQTLLENRSLVRASFATIECNSVSNKFVLDYIYCEDHLCNNS